MDKFREEIEYNIEEHQLEIENRIRNLMWTVSGDYTLEAKVNVEAFVRSKYIALYDGIKQGAFARYFDKDELAMYLVKKVYLQADEPVLVSVAQMCIEEAICEKITRERRGVASIRKQAFADILELDFEPMSKSLPGRIKIAILKEALYGSYATDKTTRKYMEELHTLRHATETMELIRMIDYLYNCMFDPYFEKRAGGLDRVLAVTTEELTEYNWKDFLSEEMYEENLGKYLERMAEQLMDQMTDTQTPGEQKNEEHKPGQKRVLLVDEESMKKVYSYIELNYGKSWLTPVEEKRINFRYCKGIHGDCGLYFTEGILKNPVRRNYQYEYARKQRDKNRYAYYDNHRAVKKNIADLTDTLKKSLTLRDEVQEVTADRGKLVPARLWRVGRTRDAKLFTRELKNHNMDLVVDVLIDASGSQRSRQAQVALQGYILSEALSNVNIPHRVMSFCTFWDYTILHRFRSYDDGREANGNIFEYTTSSNNRDGLAIQAAADGLLEREEENKIMIILSDGRPYDVILNRPNARNPQPYQGKYAARDTAFEVRKLRNLGVAVLGVFAGEEKDLATEKKIFGKDFAYIRNIEKFSRTVGRYLIRQWEE
ncbi:MAG: nitric oxide reductase activation protein [Lachnospiraceae bacterium]|nr:nitric oxide reductase activation protein [Lachnospiraceae bacterium]